jgi:hypothetical protein
MENENKNLSPEQSLDLIASMIRQTQGNVTNNSFYLLLWGWVITICNFGMYFFSTFYSPEYAAAVWLLTIPAWAVTMIHAKRQQKSRKVVTHLDKISLWLWYALGITIVPSWIFGSVIDWRVNAFILMPVGMATFVSGIIIRYKPLLVGGVIFWVAGTLCFIVSPLDQYLVGGTAMILGYLIPGYMLSRAK